MQIYQCIMDPYGLSLSSILLVLTFLVIYSISASNGEQGFSKFSTGSASQCGSLITLNQDEVFSISDILSAEGRNQKAFDARSTSHKYSSSNSFLPTPEDRKHFQQSLTNPFDTLRSLSLASPQFRKYNPHYGSAKSRSNYANRYKNKMFDFQQQDDGLKEEDEKSPEEFSNFMTQKFTRQYSNEVRMFPELPSRVDIEPIRRPQKKDILSGLSGRVGKKTKEGNSHRDSPSKLPVYVQHTLDQMKGNNPGLSQASNQPAVVEFPSEQTKFDRTGSLGKYGDIKPVMDILGSLRPEKVQELKRLLLENTGIKNLPDISTTDGGYNGERRDEMYRNNQRYPDHGMTGRTAEKLKIYQNPLYNLDSHVRTSSLSDDEDKYFRSQFDLNKANGKGVRTNDERAPGHEYDLSMWRNEHAGESGSKSMAQNRWYDKQAEIYPRHDITEYNNDRIPEAVEDDRNREPNRKKRSIVPTNAFEQFSAGMGAKLLATKKAGSSVSEDKEEKFCRWEFKRGNDCRKMVIQLQYWIDGVRDCNKEYLLITENGRKDGENKLCGGQERLAPFIVEGEKVSIVHFRETNIGSGLTKFKGSIQCQQ